MVTRTDIYGERRVRFVRLAPTNAGATSYVFSYGFLTPIDGTVGTVLGHQEITNRTPANFVFGSNSPKPARAAKQGVSSWIATARIVPARAEGWKVTRRAINRGAPFFASPPTTVPLGGSVICFVEIDTVNYAWKMPNFQYRLISAADRSNLKIQVPSTQADTEKLTFGSSFPQPGRAQKIFGTTAGTGSDIATGTKKVTTFYGDGADFENGWQSVATPVKIFGG